MTLYRDIPHRSRTMPALVLPNREPEQQAQSLRQMPEEKATQEYSPDNQQEHLDWL